MAKEYYEFVGFQETEPANLVLPHSVELLHAIWRDGDTRLVDTLAVTTGVRRELLVVDLDCDDIPNRNAPDLKSPERLAIEVTEGGAKPPSVYILRKDFPGKFRGIMHMNVAVAGQPRSMCLYFEPPRAIMRTWTAPKFLARIRWWLVGTASGTLHVADQPVELPFFEGGCELLVPPNFDELRTKQNVGFVVEAVEVPHLRGSFTMKLHVRSAGQQHPNGLSVAIVDCPPIVHSTRTEIPTTLGQIADELQAHEIDLPKLLRDCLSTQIPSLGESLPGPGRWFVILLNIPVARAAGAKHETIQRLALLVTGNRLALGLALGAYTKLDNKVFRLGVLAGQEPTATAWRELEMQPAVVLNAPTQKALRYFSTTPNQGPSAGVLVGVGALGSELLNLWTRAGWGTWTVVDSDHLKPHNLARHSGFSWQLGYPKALAVKRLADEVYGREVVTKAIVADACDTTHEVLSSALNSADLVVDCSTNLDFPRLTSTVKRTARHASVFITPNGNGGVLLAEDFEKRQQLRTLEAQYYRAIIGSDWGRDHLIGNYGSFWSGASCRDISYRLPHATIVAHAATLAEQLMRGHELPNATIRVWIRSPETGSVEAVQVPVHAATKIQVGALAVHLDEGLEAKLHEMRNNALPVETGGVLLGYHDLNLKEIVIVDALPPPPDSSHSTGHFQRGVEGLLEAYQEVQRRTADVVGYLGEWHSHPRGHSANPSTDDVLQLFKLAIGMADEGLPVLQLIVGENDLQVYGSEVVG
jgi:integrative and conjugative element protein (TIGR02256 family)